VNATQEARGGTLSDFVAISVAHYAETVESSAGCRLAILDRMEPGVPMDDVFRRMELAGDHAVALHWLRESLTDARAVQRNAVDEGARWFNASGWPAMKAHMWAALECRDYDELLTMGRWLMSSGFRCDWTEAEVAEVSTALLTGWVQRQSWRREPWQR